MTRTFDRGFFDKWYRNPRHRLRSPSELARQAALAVGVAEYVLQRRVARVLDIGAGEGEWRAALRAIRPRVTYLGLEPSPYAVRRFGRRRNLRDGRFDTLSALPDLE